MDKSKPIGKPNKAIGANAPYIDYHPIKGDFNPSRPLIASSCQIQMYAPIDDSLGSVNYENGPENLG